MSISRIECHRCGSPLAGAPADVAFACPECRLVSVYGSAGLDEQDAAGRPGRLAGIVASFRGQDPYIVKGYSAPGFSRAGSFVLPFWLFRVSSSFRTEKGEESGRHGKLAREHHFLVPAFAFHGLQLVGWPGQELDTSILPPLEDFAPKGVGISRHPLTAYILMWYLLFRKSDNVSDVSNVQMELEHRETVLTFVPVTETAGKIRFPFGPRDYPVCLFDDLDIIRQAARPAPGR